MPQGAATEAQHIIDACFALQGESVPVDHGYALYGALSTLLDDKWLHGTEDLGIHPIRGRYLGDGQLQLTPTSRLVFRLPAEFLPQVLPLAGKRLDLDGCRLRVGPPQPFLLQPAASLRARLVTTKNGHDEARFDTEIARQLGSLGIAATVTRGKRRTFRVKGKQVVGHSVTVSDLSDGGSLRLQAAGLGGRRKMGCGIFVPCSRETGEQA